MIKRVLGLMLVLLLVAPIHLAASSPDPITIYFNDEKLESSTQPLLLHSRTYVPIRVIAEKWGAVVGWNQEHQQVRITKDRQRIDLYIDQKEAFVNGEPKQSDAAPVVVQGRTMIPLRFVGELLGAYVSYDAATRTVSVLVQTADQPQAPAPSDGLDEPDRNESLATLNGIHFANDTVYVNTSGRVEPSVFTLNQPDRVVIDLPKTMIASDFVAGMFDPETYQNQIDVNSGLVKTIRYANHNPGESTVRIVIDLNAKANFQLSRDESSDGFAVSLKPGKYRVVIDAGHGGKDPGASYYGKQEKEFNLQMALRLHQLLAADPMIEPLLTRSSDVFLELQERVDFAKMHQADAFISIHANAFPQRSTVRGSETYYTHDYQREFAETLHQELVKATGFPDRGLHARNFFVTRNADIPAALVEVGYMTNPEDIAQLFQEDFQNRVAIGLLQGLKKYFGL